MPKQWIGNPTVFPNRLFLLEFEVYVRELCGFRQSSGGV